MMSDPNPSVTLPPPQVGSGAGVGASASGATRTLNQPLPGSTGRLYKQTPLWDEYLKPGSTVSAKQVLDSTGGADIVLDESQTVEYNLGREGRKLRGRDAARETPHPDLGLPESPQQRFQRDFALETITRDLRIPDNKVKSIRQQLRSLPPEDLGTFYNNLENIYGTRSDPKTIESNKKAWMNDYIEGLEKSLADPNREHPPEYYKEMLAMARARQKSGDLRAFKDLSKSADYSKVAGIEDIVVDEMEAAQLRANPDAAIPGQDATLEERKRYIEKLASEHEAQDNAESKKIAKFLRDRIKAKVYDPPSRQETIFYLFGYKK